MTAQRTRAARSRPVGKPCFDCLDEAVDRPQLATRREVAFWFIAYVFAATMLGTTLPTPLYVIWQSEWGFSSGVVTLIFAVYAAGVLAALVFAGRASDQVGRRPVLGAALGLSGLSTVVFILATSVGWLFLGRVLSGFSAGLMTGTATAALTDMLGPARPAERRSCPPSPTPSVWAWARCWPACSRSICLTPRYWCSRCTWLCWRRRPSP